MNLLRKSQGFTLAELLIALGILGVIATFTIPKVLFTAESGQNTAVAKEAASMISGAFTSFSLENSLAAGTTAGVLTQYMNYVAEDIASTTGTVGGNENCSGTLRCYRLHNGGLLQMDVSNTFGGTASTNGIYVNLDPDGTGPATPVTFSLFANGRITTADNATVTSGSPSGLTTVTTDPAYIQNW